MPQVMPVIERPSIGDGHNSLHHTTKRMLKFKKAHIDSLVNFEQKLDQAVADQSDNSYRSQVLDSYTALYNNYESLANEEKLINRIEKVSQIRNVFFRGVTTLTIGFSIMLVYWVASEFGISMPLIKFPV